MAEASAIHERASAVALSWAEIVGVNAAVYVVGGLGRVSAAPTGEVIAVWSASGVSLAALRNERERAAKALRESEARLRQFSEGMPRVIWMMNPNETRFVYANVAFERIFGRRREECTPRATSGWKAFIPKIGRACSSRDESPSQGTNRAKSFA